MVFIKGHGYWTGRTRPPFNEEWKRKIRESTKKSNAGRYVRTEETIEKIRQARLKQVFSPEARERQLSALIAMNKRRTGIHHHMWRGGVTSENKKVRTSLRYARWRDGVFAKDKYRCQECKKKNGEGANVYLEAHHVKPFCKYPELRFEISNGITLCKPCHIKTENYGRR